MCRSYRLYCDTGNNIQKAYSPLLKNSMSEGKRKSPLSLSEKGKKKYRYFYWLIEAIINELSIFRTFLKNLHKLKQEWGALKSFLDKCSSMTSSSAEISDFINYIAEQFPLKCENILKRCSWDMKLMDKGEFLKC